VHRRSWVGFDAALTRWGRGETGTDIGREVLVGVTKGRNITSPQYHLTRPGGGEAMIRGLWT
jgi:hypothetical protein